MSNGWDFDKGSKDGQKAEFTKFPVGVTRIRVIDEAPHIRWVNWMPQFRRSVNCPGKDNPIRTIRQQQKANGQEYTYSMAKRFAMNIINRDTGKQEIMEQGVTFFEDLRDIMTDLKEKGKALSDVDLKVRRRGTGKDDTSYRVDVDEEIPLSADDQKMIGTKLDLEEYFKPNSAEQILKLLNVTANTPQEYQDAWVEVMTEGKEDTTSTEEEDIEVI